MSAHQAIVHLFHHCVVVDGGQQDLRVEHFCFYTVKGPQQDSTFFEQPFPLRLVGFGGRAVVLYVDRWRPASLFVYPLPHWRYVWISHLSTGQLLLAPAAEQVGMGRFTHPVDVWMRWSTITAVTGNVHYPRLGETVAWLLGSPHHGGRPQQPPLPVALHKFPWQCFQPECSPSYTELPNGDAGFQG